MPLRTCFLGAFNLNLITIKPASLPACKCKRNYCTNIAGFGILVYKSLLLLLVFTLATYEMFAFVDTVVYKIHYALGVF
jgi:hypothetical protein